MMSAIQRYAIRCATPVIDPRYVFTLCLRLLYCDAEQPTAALRRISHDGDGRFFMRMLETAQRHIKR